MRTICSFLLTFLFFISATQTFSQSKVSLSGYIRDSKSGESLIGAAVYIQEAKQGSVSNTYGFFSTTLEAGSYTLNISHVGYAAYTRTLNLTEDRQLTIELEPQSNYTGDEIVITDRSPDENVTNTDMGTVNLSVETIKKLPVIFGETDVLKALQLTPGVQSAGEGNSGFYVRGGGPDQNLVMLDDAVVYNTGHLFGFFSVFNADALKNVTLIKGGMPARYGGRLSSVLDVNMKEGNSKSFHGEGGIGLIASRLTLEGPIVKDKGSFMLSGRRTYIDVVTKPFLKKENRGTGYYFYDLNLKANYQLSKRDRIYLSAYLGKDVFSFNSTESDFKLNIPWGNKTATLRWNHQFGSKLFMNATGVYNDYEFEFSGIQKEFEIGMRSSIRDLNGKIDFDYYPLPGHHIKFGGVYTYHRFTPSQYSGMSSDTAIIIENPALKYAHETAVYLQDEFSIGHFLKINAGIRYSWFGQTGPYTSYTFGVTGEKTDSTEFKSGELVSDYGGWEPRLNARFQINKSSSIKLGITKTYQYMHLVSNNGSTLPTDIWVPSSQLVKPQKSWQYAIGYFKNFMDNKLETSIEVYYKDMRNQIEYRSGYMPGAMNRDLATNRDLEYDFVFGSGEAYGTELFVRKNQGKLTGWIGYTLSWTWRKFPDLNGGDRFPAKYDRRHDLSVVASYELNDKITFSGVFVYGSGNAITLPTGYYFVEQNLVQDFSKINEYRIFPYHRLDLSMIYTPGARSAKRWKSSWAFSIYNVYSRLNPYILYVDSDGTLTEGTTVKVKQISIFPIIPSITYNFKF